jgi:hypothetical protein
MNESPPYRQKWLLLFEIMLILILGALSVVYYWRPAAVGFTRPQWWHVLVLGGLLFLILALHMWRRGRDRRRELHESIRSS